MPTVTLSSGTIDYDDVGSGPVILFIHGLLVNKHLWRKVVPTLSGQYRCITPTLPLGGHTHPATPTADLTPPGVARLIAAFIEKLDLRDVTIVGNDTGGALVQLVIVNHPERIARVILTNCDAFENFYPPLLRVFQYGAAIPGFTSLVAQSTRLYLVQWLLLILAARRMPEKAVRDSYFTALQTDRNIVRDLRAFLRGVSNRYTLDAARRFPQLSMPVLIVWGRDDWLFPPVYAERLKRAFADARIAWVNDSRAFVSEDQPDVLAQQIAQFVGQRELATAP